MARIIQESPLVQTFRDTHSTIEKNFVLTHLTIAHADPDMTKTFEVVRRSYHERSVHDIQAGRGSTYCIPDMLDRGQELMQIKDVNEEEDDVGDVRPELDDVAVEL